MSRSSAALTSAIAGVVVALPIGAHAQTFKVDKFDISGAGRTDYLTAQAGAFRVFVSRSTHVMVVDGPTGKVVGDIPDSPGNHGIALSEESNHGFVTNGGDSTLTMFDLTTLAVIKKIPVRTGGLDGIMHDDFNDRIILTTHSRPIGTVTIVDARTGDIVGAVNLADNGPEGAASDGKGKLFVNLEGKSMIEVIDTKTMTSVGTWPLAPCDGPSGIAMDRSTDRLFVGCDKTSVVVDATSGKIVAQIANGDGVDALGWDQSEKLIYIPAGRDGTVTVAHEDSPDSYSVVATVKTMTGVKTIAVDPVRHIAYGFVPEFGPAPAPAPGTPPPAAGGRGGPRGPIIAAWFFVISH